MKKTLLLLFLTALATVNLVSFANASAKILPKQARNMNPFKVRQIYSEHTWVWGTGGAYFAKDGTFYATSGKGDALSTAAGRWLVTPGGRLCFFADWSNKTKVFQNVKTCFNHAEYKRQYFQAKDISGKWYVIKSVKPKSNDMFNMIKSGDKVACRFLASEKKLKRKVTNIRVAQALKGAICNPLPATKPKIAIQ